MITYCFNTIDIAQFKNTFSRLIEHLAADNENMSRYCIPGQHTHDGITLAFPTFPGDLVDRMKTFPLTKEDVVVVGYPRSGEITN